MSSSLTFNLLRCSVPPRGSQKDTKTPSAKGEKSGNEIAARKAPLREPLALAPYSKSKLSNKPICRKTIKSIKQQLKANGKTIEESLLDLPRFTLYFILHGKVIQEYLDMFAINSGCAPLTVDDVRKVIADNRLGEQIDIEKYDRYDITNKGCNIDDPFVIEYDSGYVPIVLWPATEAEQTLHDGIHSEPVVGRADATALP